ncbi:hypothetical protein DNTS_035671, partial [Danionella cerebrum]
AELRGQNATDHSLALQYEETESSANSGSDEDYQPSSSSSSTEGEELTVIHSMQQDHVTSHIRNDVMICAYGDALFARKGREQSQHRYIAQKMRELGRLVLSAKEIESSVKGLKDLCEPTKFELVLKATRRLSNYSTNTTEYGKPSTAVKIGFSLKGATETWIGHCLMRSNTLAEKRAKKFKELLDNRWSSYVSTNAHSTMEQRRWNCEDCLPLTEDVISLQNYLRKIEDEAKAELIKHASTTAYKMLSESLLAQIIVFNKKREGEASRLNLETYLKADVGPMNKDIYETLSAVEKQLSHRLTRVVTRGKRGRKVPILLIERTKASLDFLIKKRTEDDDWCDDEENGVEQRFDNRSKRIKRARKIDDGDVRKESTREPPVTSKMKSATERRSIEDNWSDEGGAQKKQQKKLWTKEERTAVQQNMSKFVALRRVPGKNDCLLCIGKASPVLSNRTWKDVKYFVYNEIIKVKKNLKF